MRQYTKRELCEVLDVSQSTLDACLRKDIIYLEKKYVGRKVFFSLTQEEVSVLKNKIDENRGALTVDDVETTEDDAGIE